MDNDKIFTEERLIKLTKIIEKFAPKLNNFYIIFYNRKKTNMSKLKQIELNLKKKHKNIVIKKIEDNTLDTKEPMVLTCKVEEN